MAPLACSMCSLILLPLLLAVAPCPAQAGKPFGHPCSSPWQGLLDCRHAGLATVPPATSTQPLDMLDFTGNSISTLGPQTWEEYQWTETLILKDNELQAVKSHSLEGLFLLKHLDLSGNNIKSIEERAFEPLPFLEHLNLSGNQLTQIPSGAFEAWHGMQFLQELILSHNPLTLIADTAFFKLPSVSYLDLSATQVSAQTLLLLLQTASHLETLKVPRAVSCCLCKERGTVETPCRTIQFLCENLCGTSTAQCGSLAQKRTEIMAAAQSGQLRSSSVLYVKPKGIPPAHHGSITLAVAREQASTKSDLGSQGDSRADSYSSQHLSSQGREAIDELLVKLHNIQNRGWTGDVDSEPNFLAEQLAAGLQSQQPHAQSTLAVANIVPRQPAPARRNVQKFPAVEGKQTTGWEQKQLESGLNWPILSRWDVAGGSNPLGDSFAFGHHSAKESAAPQRSSVRTYQRRQRDTGYQLPHNPLFYEVSGDVAGEEEPTPGESEGLDRKPENLLDLWLKSHPEDSAEEERSSLGESGKPAEARSGLAKEAGGSQSPGRAPAPAELPEAGVEHPLGSQVPDEALRTFIARVTGALSAECSRPDLQLPCARMVSRAGLLAKRLSPRQDSQEISALTRQCLRLALEMGKESAGKQNAGLNHSATIVTRLLVFVVIMIFAIIFVLIMIMLYLVQTHCWESPEDVWEDTVKSPLSRFLEKLRCGELRDMLSCAFGGEGEERARNVRQGRPSACCPLALQSVPDAGGPTQGPGEFQKFEEKVMLLMEEDARALRLYDWHRQRRDDAEAEAASENSSEQQDE
ncbi:leucine-rich repeat-containing protein 37A-like isoform X1 [Neopelma chrysocephalum]|uniref:leucine-rich repeat-containing protein 37A-like isoform X1 n=1 Tax=Neopelma chrysocephalum TaxID=114329 RepID=UPI000FCCF200|nr:leucine-rich repeat-containing protein 37A-like isoform X1 [Neopelma chrysocephalum]